MIWKDSPDKEVTVTYYADNENADFTYFDDTTNTTLKVIKKSGKSNASIGYTTTDDINNYEKQSYILVSDDTDGRNLNFDSLPATNQHYTIHLKHHITNLVKDNPAERTITITFPDGSVEVVVQKVGYKYNVHIDDVIGKETDDEAYFDEDTSNVMIYDNLEEKNGKEDKDHKSYVYNADEKRYYFAPLKLKHINGYKAKLIPTANPAMFLVSFIALPNIDNSQDENNSDQKQEQPDNNQKTNEKQSPVAPDNNQKQTSITMPEEGDHLVIDQPSDIETITVPEEMTTLDETEIFAPIDQADSKRQLEDEDRQLKLDVKLSNWMINLSQINQANFKFDNKNADRFAFSYKNVKFIVKVKNNKIYLLVNNGHKHIYLLHYFKELKQVINIYLD